MIKDKENRKMNQKMRNQKVIPVRFSVAERAMIDNIMARQGWENMSGFIKNKIFNDDPEEELQQQIDSRDPRVIGTFLIKSVLEFTDYYMYVKFRYDKDMNQLYREEGIDINKWKKATNKWISELTKRTESYLTLIRKIADAVGLETYFELPSDKMKIDPENSTTEEMDALALQLQKERIAMGHDILDMK